MKTVAFRALLAVLTMSALAACASDASDGAQGSAGTRQAGGQPAAAKWQSGAPVGLFFMTRFWPSSGSLEKSVWYFAPDGTVYENLTTGFSDADLAAHTGQKGKAVASGEEMEVTWSDGKKTKASFSRSATGFGFNAGIFTPVKPITNPESLAGRYEGGESLSGGRGATSNAIELRADGTYTSGSVGSVSSRSSESTVSAGGTATTGGKWSASSYSITLTDPSGKSTRHIAFPYDDASTPITPDHLYIGGILYKRR